MENNEYQTLNFITIVPLYLLKNWPAPVQNYDMRVVDFSVDVVLVEFLTL